MVQPQEHSIGTLCSAPFLVHIIGLAQNTAQYLGRLRGWQGEAEAEVVPVKDTGGSG